MGKVAKAINNAINPFYKTGGNGNDNFTIYGAGAAYGHGGRGRGARFQCIGA